MNNIALALRPRGITLLPQITKHKIFARWKNNEVPLTMAWTALLALGYTPREVNQALLESMRVPARVAMREVTL